MLARSKSLKRAINYEFLLFSFLFFLQNLTIGFFHQDFNCQVKFVWNFSVEKIFGFVPCVWNFVYLKFQKMLSFSEYGNFLSLKIFLKFSINISRTSFAFQLLSRIYCHWYWCLHNMIDNPERSFYFVFFPFLKIVFGNLLQNCRLVFYGLLRQLFIECH